MESALERVPVVTSIVYSGDKLTLIKRSDKVGTYKGAWAGFSGYVERLPLNQAWQELSEEAGITPSGARLTGIGIPVEVDDVEGGRKWLVFPFLFQSADGIEIKTDWEAAELGWFDREDIRKLDTAPGLDAVIDSVWPAFGDSEFWGELAAVATNVTYGATELARRGLAALGGFVQSHYEELGPEDLVRAIRAFAACRPVMGVFPDLAARLMLAIEREPGQFSFDELTTELIGVLNDATEVSVSYTADALRDKLRLFTLSYSEPVRDAILTWSEEGSEVLVAESAPRFEGVRLVNDLRQRGVSARAIADDQIRYAVREADIVLVGCDAITSNDQLVNKVGTSEVVAVAKSAGIPVYAMAQTFKVVPPEWPVFLERQSPADHDEPADTPGVPIFDMTPVEQFDAIITEEGPLRVGRLNEIRDSLGSVELVPGE